MAQLGDYERARKLLRRAARGFGARERLAQARCQVAEIDRARRALSSPSARLIRAGVVRLIRLDEVEALFAVRPALCRWPDVPSCSSLSAPSPGPGRRTCREISSLSAPSWPAPSTS